MQSKTMKAVVMIGIAAVLMLVSGQAMAADGKALFATKGCTACHGPDGKAPLMPLYPKLAGQNAPYLVDQLKAFKAQTRKNGQAALMWGQAAQLSDAEMDAIAKYLASVK